MGMFDWIKYECVCPRCNGKVDGFQSKDNICQLEELEPHEVDNFYSNCESCGARIVFDVKKTGKKIPIIKHIDEVKITMRPVNKERTKNRG